MSTNKPNSNPVNRAILAILGFIFFLVLAVLFSVYNRQLSFLTPSLYFFLLMPMALLASAFLFGAMKSYAKYSGKAYNGTLELGGPVVLFALILLLGIKAAPKRDSLQLAVNIFGDSAQTEIINSGKVHLYFGNAKMTKEISDGQAIFNELPANAANELLSISADVEGYKGSRQTINVPAGNNAVTYILQKNKEETLQRGIVINSKGNPVENAIVVIEDGLVKDTTDELGHFSTFIPLKEGTEVNIRVYRQNKIIYNNLHRISGNVSLTLLQQ